MNQELDKKTYYLDDNSYTEEGWKKIDQTLIQKAVSFGMSVPHSDNLDFGDKNFTIIPPSIPPVFYINKTFICTICGYQAEHSTNLEGEPKNKPFCPECFKKANIPVMELKSI
jgi:hypothetical protein